MTKARLLPLLLSTAMVLVGCSDAQVPGARDVTIPPPRAGEERKDAVNERPDAVMYLPLGHDVLVPEAKTGSPLPPEMVGPFELRGETLAGALQLILDEVDIPVAFESEEGLSRTITVTNLKGELSTVVDRVCSLADLYCSFENGTLVVKNEQIFTVTLPPIGGEEQEDFLETVNGAIAEITGKQVYSETATRTLIYRATQRTAELAERYFQKLRSSTALIVFETYIWEVSLNAGNSTGINWDEIGGIGKWNVGIELTGAVDPTLGTPVSIGLPTQGDVDLSAGDVVDFISDYGAVKTISQPQITVLSGSSARLRVADTQNYVASITRSVSEGEVSVSTTTSSVDSGFTLELQSGWDNATVYGSLNILLQEVRDIETFDDNPDAVVQLPQTTERELTTQVRVRPGDSLLIAGLVREIDTFDENGPGLNSPIIPTSRSAGTSNVELVFLLKPRVIAFTSDSSVAGHSMTRATSVAPTIESVVAEPALTAVAVSPEVVVPQVTTPEITTPLPRIDVKAPAGTPEDVVESKETSVLDSILEKITGGKSAANTEENTEENTVPAPITAPSASIVSEPIPSAPIASVPMGNPVEITPLPLAMEPATPSEKENHSTKSTSKQKDNSVIVDYDALNASGAD